MVLPSVVVVPVVVVVVVVVVVNVIIIPNGKVVAIVAVGRSGRGVGLVIKAELPPLNEGIQFPGVTELFVAIKGVVQPIRRGLVRLQEHLPLVFLGHGRGRGRRSVDEQHYLADLALHCPCSHLRSFLRSFVPLSLVTRLRCHSNLMHRLPTLTSSGVGPSSGFLPWSPPAPNVFGAMGLSRHTLAGAINHQRQDPVQLAAMPSGPTMSVPRRSPGPRGEGSVDANGRRQACGAAGSSGELPSHFDPDVYLVS